MLFIVKLYGLESSLFKSVFDEYSSFCGSGTSNKVSFVFEFELSARETYQSHQA